MKIISVESLKIPEIKIIKFARFKDYRGYFTEQYRESDLKNHPELEEMKKYRFVQANQSMSKRDTIRGLHFQWNPYMGKLVRTITGRMVDIVLDIRKNSPTYGKIILYDLPASDETDYDTWIWVPPGFAHGNYFTEKTIIEYFCTGEYSPNCESGISPLAKDIDWSICDENLKKEFQIIVARTDKISEKDRDGQNLTEWSQKEESDNFVY